MNFLLVQLKHKYDSYDKARERVQILAFAAGKRFQYV